MDAMFEQHDTNERVKVVVRLRPMNATEETNEENLIVNVNVKRDEICVTKLKKIERNPSHSPAQTEVTPFTFDAVLDNSLTQNEIYEKVFKSLVDSVVRGYNATIFAYGQTGTGKTFTMEGSLNSEETFGVMPNAFKHIFDQVAQHQEKRYLIAASYFEIYQEEIRDLLTTENVNKCVIQERQNGIHIKNLSSYLCRNFQQISELMVKGRKNRVVGSTNMNEHSSRSHAVFQIIIETSDENGENIKVGKLNLVDLAGSERVSKTRAEGLRLKEATKINLSLSTLGNVISALVDGSSFIPYRDSKLTRILQDSLGGNSRTVMVATVGPAAFNYEETINTLRYASRAKSIENKPRVNENPKDAVLRKYQEEINRLRKMVEEKKARLSGPTTSARTNLKEEETDLKAVDNGNVHIHMIDTGRAKELKEMLESLGIKFGGNVEEIRRQLKEKTESLEKDTLMLKEDKEKLAADLQKATSELQFAEHECDNLMAQITWLESKVLNSSAEDQLLEKMQSQKAEIEEKEKELESHKLRHDELRKALDEKQLTCEETRATFTKVENEYNANLEKLEKITRRLANYDKDKNKTKKKHTVEAEKLKECIAEMSKELKLKKTIVDNFVPRKIRKDIDERMRYETTSDTYFVEPSAKERLEGAPTVNKMLQFPIFNLSRFQNLRPMNNTFFSNENILLLDPLIPHWPVKNFILDKTNPKIESLIKGAIKDMENAMVINCDHKANMLRIKTSDPPSYVAVGNAILLKNVRSEKFVDFSRVPSDIKLPNGSNVFPLEIPRRSASGTKFSQEQLLAFPLIKYSGLGELCFEEEIDLEKPKVKPKTEMKEKSSKRHQKNLEEMIWKPSNFGLKLDFNKMEQEFLSQVPPSPLHSPEMFSRPTSAVPQATPRSILKSPNKPKVSKSFDTTVPNKICTDLPNPPLKTFPNDETILNRIKYFASRNECRKQAEAPHVSFKESHIFNSSKDASQSDIYKSSKGTKESTSANSPCLSQKSKPENICVKKKDAKDANLDNPPTIDCGEREVSFYDFSCSDSDFETEDDSENSNKTSKNFGNSGRPPTRPTSQRMKELVDEEQD